MQNDETILSDLTRHELEVIKLELEQFFQTKLYQIFLQTCDQTKLNLLDACLGTTLRGVESLFTREGVLGEAQCWKNVKVAFTELLEDINETLKTK